MIRRLAGLCALGLAGCSGAELGGGLATASSGEAHLFEQLPYLPAEGWSLREAWDLRSGMRCSSTVFQDASAEAVIASLESIGFVRSPADTPVGLPAICAFVRSELGGAVSVLARPQGPSGGPCELAAVRADGKLFAWSPG